MTSTTSSVNVRKQVSGVFRWQLRQSAGITAVYGALLALALPVLTVFALSGREYLWEYRDLEERITEAARLIQELSFLAMALTALFALILGVFHFGFLHRKRELDLFHAIPVQRVPMFFGRFLSGLISLSAPVVLVALLQGAACACFGLLDGRVAFLLLQVCGILLLMGTAMFSFIVLMAVCSGSTMDTLISTALISISWPVSILLGKVVICQTVPGVTTLDIPDSLLTAFSPFTAAFLALDPASRNAFAMRHGVFFFGWWVFLTAALIVTAAFLYRRRKSETAESIVSFGPVKAAIRIFTCTASGLLFGYLIYTIAGDKPLSFYMGVFISSLLTYLVTELLYARSLKYFVRHLPLYGGAAAVLLCFLLAVSLGAFGMDTYLPAAEGLDCISIECEGEGLYNISTPVSVIPEGKEEAYELYPGVQSPENIEEALKINELLIRSEKSRQYPYLIGGGKNWRTSTSEEGEYIGITLKYFSGGKMVQRSYSRVIFGETEADALFREAGDRTRQLIATEEYIAGSFCLNMIDVALGVEIWNNEKAEQKDTVQADSADTGEVQFSSLPNKEEFFRRLEQALTADLQNGRYTDYNIDSDTLYFEIWYGDEGGFTARGGFCQGQPAAGKKFSLRGAPSLTVTENMTETFGLLQSLFP